MGCVCKHIAWVKCKPLCSLCRQLDWLKWEHTCSIMRRITEKCSWSTCCLDTLQLSCLVFVLTSVPLVSIAHFNFISFFHATCFSGFQSFSQFSKIHLHLHFYCTNYRFHEIKSHAMSLLNRNKISILLSLFKFILSK